MLAEQLREELALFGTLPDDIGLAFPWMHIDVVARDVDVAAQHDFAALIVPMFCPGSQLVQEGELGAIVFAAVRHIHGGEHDVAPLRLHDPALHIERRMAELRLGVA